MLLGFRRTSLVGGLILTTQPQIGASGEGKVRFFNTADAVQTVFGAESPATRAAQEWFSYNPYPQGLYIGRWAHEFVATVLQGSPITANAASLDALKNAAASFRVLEQDVSVNTSASDSFAAVAQAIQNELRAGGALSGRLESIAVTNGGSSYSSVPAVTIEAPTGAGGVQATATAIVEGQVITGVTITNPGAGYETAPAIGFTGGGGGSGGAATATLERNALVPTLTGSTFAYENGAFVLRLASSEAIDPAYFEASNSAPETDISTALGLAQGQATYLQGSEQEVPSDAVSAILGILSRGTPTYLAYDAGVPRVYGDADTEVDVNLWTYVESSQLIFSFTDTSLAARRDRNESTSLLARANLRQLTRTMVCVGDDDRRPHIAALAALSSINWEQPNSIITLFAKTFPGVLPTPISFRRAGSDRRQAWKFLRKHWWVAVVCRGVHGGGRVLVRRGGVHNLDVERTFAGQMDGGKKVGTTDGCAFEFVPGHGVAERRPERRNPTWAHGGSRNHA